MKAVKILVVGIVQGVGFRPFVYRLASSLGIRGYVKNVGGSAVEIFAEGEESDIERFQRALVEERPPSAYIESLHVTEERAQGYRGFEILESDPHTLKRSMIPPDISVCDDCLREVLDPGSRFHLYPFHSCANCGPRFSMMSSIPYDRVNTSMADFPMCPKCVSEYSDPENRRRFHVQGISCPECGPRVTLRTRDFEYVADGYEAIEAAGRLIDEGYILAVKGLGGYHVAASATMDDVVEKLRARKRRPTKPFAVMALDLEAASRIVHLPDAAKRLLTSKERPIVLLEARQNSRISRLVAPGLRHIGVFLPYTPLHFLLLKNTSDKYAIMTSGNPSGEPMCIDDECLREKLSGFVDYVLTHNRRIVNRVDDSVVRFTGGRAVILRRGRGFAPTWIRLPFRLEKPVIAFGAMLQSAGAVGFEDRAVLTQYIGDVDEYGCFRDLERYLEFLVRSYCIDVSSSVIASDMHPRYPSTILAEAWARKSGVRPLKIQHHWAHIASAMVEHGLDEEVVGIAIDGLGYGLDGTMWGGEVMRADYQGFERVGHLEPQPMPGGDLAVRYPARMLAGILSKTMSENEIARIFRRLEITQRGLPKGEEELRSVLRQVPRSPMTSSTGRVLDAASALLGVCYERTYEGEPAIRLEAISERCGDTFDVKITNDTAYVIDTTSIILRALELLEEGRERGEIAYMIQKSIGYALGLVASKAARRSTRYLILSGGAAVNDYILEGVEEAVKESGLRLLLPEKYPANDGGIALGQIAIAGRLACGRR